MAGIGNNLYPPIFKKAYLPAFVGDKCYIYFSLSVYNSQESFNKDLIQVSIQNQNTNYSALNQDLYPAGIMMKPLNINPDRNADDKYYIIVDKRDLLNEKFEPGEYYKVQIRFTDKQLATFQNTDEWFTANLSYFSEWSQVVLIKYIEVPQVKLRNFEDAEEEDGKTFTLKDIQLTGRVDFNPQDNEYLKKYRVFLYDSSKTLIEDSKDIFSDIYTNINEIKYKIKTVLNNEESYQIIIKFQSNNLYEWQEKYDFTLNLIQFTILDPNNVFIIAEADRESGWADVHVYSLENIQEFGMNLVIRRSSSRDSFNTEQDMYIFAVQRNKKIDFHWHDRTIESGVWYKYSVQQINAEGFRSNIIRFNIPIMCEFEDIFLLNNEKQLKIRFNPQVNNYSHVVAESLTQTIGSKYPFIRRNGNTNYRTFSLSGTITHFMDRRQNGMKAAEKDLYNKSIFNDYQTYKEQHNITPYNNFLYERDFREEVIKFLYENNVKLYKSTTQGNILVKIMNISFTPNNTLSRQIYDFTCTLQQVDEFNIDNCDLYNIQNRGEYNYKSKIVLTQYGQIIMPDYNLYYKENSSPEAEAYNNRNIREANSKIHFVGSKDLIKEYILPKYDYLKTDLIDVRIEYLHNLKIQFTSPPYLITIENGKYSKYNKKESSTSPILTGHIIYINGQAIIVGPEGIYELSDPETRIISLSFLSELETGVISYEAKVAEFEKANTHPKSYANIRKIGQLFGHFNIADSIFGKIYKKYYFDSSQMTKRLQHIRGMRIYANPYTLLLVKERQDNVSYNPALIGETGLLEFYDIDVGDIDTNDTDITGIYPLGPKLIKVTENRELRDNEYIYEEGTSYNGTQDIINPKKNHVYSVVQDTTAESITMLKEKLFPTNEENMVGLKLNENEDMMYQDLQTILLILKERTLNVIYYQGGWELFSMEDETVLVPMPMIIDYYCEILKKEYK